MGTVYTVTPGSIEAEHVADTYKDGDADAPSLRTLGTGPLQAAAGDHTHAGGALADGDYGDVAVSGSGTALTVETVGGVALGTAAFTAATDYAAAGHNHTGTYQPLSSSLTAVAGVTVTSAGTALLDDANAAAQRTTLGLGTAATTASTDYQPVDATLTSIAALGTAADKIAYTTGVDTWAEAPLTAAARSVLDDTTVGAMRTTLGLGTAAVADLGVTGQATTVVQPHQGFTKRHEWLTTGNSVAITSLGMGASSNTGTPTQRNITAGSLFGWSRRCGFVSSASAGQSAGPRLGVLQFGLGDVAGGGGFALAIRFGVSDASTVANSRMFVGFTGSTSVIGNVEPSSLTNIIGVGCDAGETVLSILNNDGSGTATKTSIGANFPSQTLSTDLYRLELWCAPNGSTVTYRVTRENTNNTATGTISSDLPAGSQLLAPQLWRNNGSTALAVGIDMFSVYIETSS